MPSLRFISILTVACLALPAVTFADVDDKPVGRVRNIEGEVLILGQQDYPDLDA